MSIDNASLSVVVIATCIKLLCIPSYHSTDFEVHRNWLAITHSTPLSEWYFEHSSIWTLDYPPFFAYFEKVLSVFANIIDPSIVQLRNIDYAVDKVVYFQRLSVIITDIVLIWAVIRFCSASKSQRSTTRVTSILVFLNAGLLIVDHIHFQYNGVLLGLLILCLDFAQREQYIATAVTFSILVLMKHLFVPLAPLFAMYLLRRHCMNGAVFVPLKFLQLAVVAATCLGLAFGPFLLQTNGKQQLLQIFSRLFPFGRGLVHAYWAPNVWALYMFSDRVILVLARFLPALQTCVRSRSNVSTTSGLVGDFPPAVIPPVPPSFSLALVCLSMLPALFLVYRSPRPRTLVAGTVYCSLSSFMLGYHVHEKAVLVPMVCLALLARSRPAAAALYLHLAAVGVICLFPLLTGLRELPLKVFMYLSYLALSWLCLADVLEVQSHRRVALQIVLLAVLLFLTDVVHPLVFTRRDGSLAWPFLPLMAYSVVGAIQMCGIWFLSWRLVRSEADDPGTDKSA